MAPAKVQNRLQAPPPEVWLTPEEVRIRLKISRSKFYVELAVGNLPHVKMGRMVRISERELDQWLQSKRV